MLALKGVCSKQRRTRGTGPAAPCPFACAAPGRSLKAKRARRSRAPEARAPPGAQDGVGRAGRRAQPGGRAGGRPVGAVQRHAADLLPLHAAEARPGQPRAARQHGARAGAPGAAVPRRPWVPQCLARSCEGVPACAVFAKPLPLILLDGWAGMQPSRAQDTNGTAARIHACKNQAKHALPDGPRRPSKHTLTLLRAYACAGLVPAAGRPVPGPLRELRVGIQLGLLDAWAGHPGPVVHVRGRRQHLAVRLPRPLLRGIIPGAPTRARDAALRLRRLRPPVCVVACLAA